MDRLITEGSTVFCHDKYKSVFFIDEASAHFFDELSYVKNIDTLYAFCFKMLTDKESHGEDYESFIQHYQEDTKIEPENTHWAKFPSDWIKENLNNLHWKNLIDVLHLIHSDSTKDEKWHQVVFEHPLNAFVKTVRNLPPHHIGTRWFLELHEKFNWTLFSLLEKQLGLIGCYLIPTLITDANSPSKDEIIKLVHEHEERIISVSKEVKRIQSIMERSRSNFLNHGIEEDPECEEFSQGARNEEKERLTTLKQEAQKSYKQKEREIIGFQTLLTIFSKGIVLRQEKEVHFYLLNVNGLSPVNIFRMSKDNFDKIVGITTSYTKRSSRTPKIVVINKEIDEFVDSTSRLKGCVIKKFPIKNPRLAHHKIFDMLGFFLKELSLNDGKQPVLSGEELKRFFSGKKKISQQIGNLKDSSFFNYAFENEGSSSISLNQAPVLILISKK